MPVKTFISLRNETSYPLLSKSLKLAGELIIQTIPSDSNIIFCDFDAQAANVKAKDSNGFSGNDILLQIIWNHFTLFVCLFVY